MVDLLQSKIKHHIKRSFIRLNLKFHHCDPGRHCTSVLVLFPFLYIYLTEVVELDTFANTCYAVLGDLVPQFLCEVNNAIAHIIRLCNTSSLNIIKYLISSDQMSFP